MGSVHPSLFSVDDAAGIVCPILTLPSKDEAPLLDLKEALEAIPEIGQHCVWQRFDDMHHGWCGARGDWTVPEQARRATEAIELTKTFFAKHLQ